MRTEYQELLEHLTHEWEMKPEYAQAFLDAYKRDVGKKLANGRRQMEKAMGGNDPTLSLAAYANMGQEQDYSLVAQAYEGYMTDLRRGRHVGTLVEKAIWAILFNRGDLIESIDRPFQKFIEAKCDEKFPGLLDEAFAAADDEPQVPEAPSTNFALSGSMPDVTQRPPLAIYHVGSYALLLVENARAIAERAVGERIPIDYMYVLTVLERSTMTPWMFVTLERGLPGTLFLCAFNPHGEHLNLGDGQPFCTAQSFVRASVEYACRTLGVSVSDVQRVSP